MPQLIFKGVRPEDVRIMSKTLPAILSEISDTPEDYFTFEVPSTTYFSNGEVFDMYPLVEIKQFRRKPEVEAEMAGCVAGAVTDLGYEECEVYFIHIGDEDYHCF